MLPSRNRTIMKDERQCIVNTFLCLPRSDVQYLCQRRINKQFNDHLKERKADQNENDHHCNRRNTWILQVLTVIA